MPAIVLGKLGFNFGTRTFVLFRADRQGLSHLTISWNNPSGEVDFHLTGDSADLNDREPILRIQEAEFKAQFVELVRQTAETAFKNPIRVIWAVNPRWLASNGYRLVGPGSEEIGLWLQKALSKKRGKYRIDAATFRKLPKSSLFNATPTHFGKLGSEGHMYAIRIARNGKDNLLALTRMDLGLTLPVWMAISCDDMGKLIKTVTRSRVLPNWFEKLAPAAWAKIQEALKLNDVNMK
jgi:hypothetical protein